MAVLHLLVALLCLAARGDTLSSSEYLTRLARHQRPYVQWMEAFDFMLREYAFDAPGATYFIGATGNHTEDALLYHLLRNERHWNATLVRAMVTRAYPARGCQCIASLDLPGDDATLYRSVVRSEWGTAWQRALYDCRADLGGAGPDWTLDVIALTLTAFTPPAHTLQWTRNDENKLRLHGKSARVNDK